MTDRSYTYQIQGPPTSWLIKKVVGKDKLSKMPKHQYIGYMCIGHLYEIAKIKKEFDHNLKDLPLKSICKVNFLRLILEYFGPMRKYRNNNYT